MGKGTKPKSQGYSLLLKDSVIYGAGRALQKFLVALLLPLYTAFLTPSDYGILGMVVTVTTFLDVLVTLGFDVAFSRFYFDDKSPQARRRVITNVFYVSTVYPLILLGTVGVLMPQLAPVLLGKEYDPGDWRYFAVALATLFFSNINDLPFTLFRLEHRPWIFSAYTIGRMLRTGTALHRVRRGLRLGADGSVARQPLHRRRYAVRAAPDVHPQGRLALARTADETDAGVRRPGALHGHLVLLAQAIGPLLSAALPGQGRRRSVHGRVLSQPAAVPHADGVPHGVAAVALRQAARARAAQADGARGRPPTSSPSTRSCWP